MKKVLNLYKLVGMTPLEVLNKFRAKNSEYKDVKMAYAGRLDPMAEGVLVVVVGDENKKINSYMGMDKEYEAEVLIGFKSDSYDLLGVAWKAKEELDYEDKIKGMKGKMKQELPAYSSYKIKGKPMFWYARNNILPKKMPVNNIEIKKIDFEGSRGVKGGVLLKKILKKIDLVKGDFRQEKIKTKWVRLLKEGDKYKIVKFNVRCSSGTYIRSIANDLGGVLFSLVRTKVGRYGFEKSIKI